MKTLVVSHMPFLSYDAMGKTFCSLFSCFAKDEICQFYIYPSIPDVDKCESYFRITDKDVLHNLLKRNFGREITKEEIARANSRLFEDANDENLYRSPKNKKPVRKLMRDLMWSVSHWYNTKLITWIKEEKPTVIFVAPGTAKFIYNIAMKISKRFHLPIVSYICDDYYFVKNDGAVLTRIEVGLLKRKIEQLMKHTCEIVCISDEIKSNYESKFNVRCTTLMTGSSFCIDSSAKYYIEEKHDANAFVYLGNIRCNRYQTLIHIGKTLAQINQKKKTNYRLKIYTSEKDVSILNQLQAVQTIELCGFVSGEEFLQTLCSAEVLVHTESFDECTIDLVKNSISTKIADSLASGRKILAYGPESVASIKYLKNNQAAFVATKESELEQVLISAISKNGEEIIANAKECAIKHHNAYKTSQGLRDCLVRVSK